MFFVFQPAVGGFLVQPDSFLFCSLLLEIFFFSFRHGGGFKPDEVRDTIFSGVSLCIVICGL